jgi:hypothetical protein
MQSTASIYENYTSHYGYITTWNFMFNLINKKCVYNLLFRQNCLQGGLKTKANAYSILILNVSKHEYAYNGFAMRRLTTVWIALCGSQIDPS